MAPCVRLAQGKTYMQLEQVGKNKGVGRSGKQRREGKERWMWSQCVVYMYGIAKTWIIKTKEKCWIKFTNFLRDSSSDGSGLLSFSSFKIFCVLSDFLWRISHSGYVKSIQSLKFALAFASCSRFPYQNTWMGWCQCPQPTQWKTMQGHLLSACR